MSHGDYDTPITFKRQTGGTVNNAGTYSKTLEDIVVFGRVVEITGGERFRRPMNSDLSERIAQIECWYFGDVKETDFVVFEGQQWNISNVQYHDRKTKTVCVVRRRA